jgi:hypothetical protein
MGRRRAGRDDQRFFASEHGRTPFRVINFHTCNSCWNDPSFRFDHKDFLWCPRHKDTARQFECTRLITADHVKRIIESVPDFEMRKERMSNHNLG